MTGMHGSMAVGLANVAKECIKNKIPRLIVLSAASCTDSGDQVCTAKTAGEQVSLVSKPGFACLGTRIMGTTRHA